jgi:ABC-2 type transport system ATP-binding protein
MLSTHRMNEVEELCDRIFMINRGQQVLYGEIGEIKSMFRKNSVLLECQGDPGEIAGVRIRRVNSTTLELSLDASISPQQLLEILVARYITINRFEVATPSLNDIFIQIAGGRK